MRSLFEKCTKVNLPLTVGSMVRFWSGMGAVVTSMSSSLRLTSFGNMGTRKESWCGLIRPNQTVNEVRFGEKFPKKFEEMCH